MWKEEKVKLVLSMMKRSLHIVFLSVPQNSIPSDLEWMCAMDSQLHSQSATPLMMERYRSL